MGLPMWNKEDIRSYQNIYYKMKSALHVLIVTRTNSE